MVNESENRKGNREYQDSMFRALFSDEESAIELYNAIEGTNFGPETNIKFVTLENVLYVNLKNDLGFEIADRFVVLMEHQSTINYNMPARQLQYVAEVVKRALEKEDLFKKKRVPLLIPEFYVIYTGAADWNEKELRLSDSFVGKPPENSMELVVKVIDVRYNKEEAKEILSRSAKLHGYSLLLSYIKGYLREGEILAQAIDLAVERCIEEDVLRDFLVEHRKEAKGMLENISVEEFVELRVAEEVEERCEEASAKAREEGLAEGRAEGRAEEREKIAKNLLAAGIEIATIATGTGLTEEAILRLKEED